ncbi:hypothetical protein P3G55_21935 [Leptospira sp. 96542]|nr:hypothetical protein [Leptospira sp. 96542]
MQATLTPQQAWPFPVADAPAAQPNHFDGVNSAPVTPPSPATPLTPPAIGQYWPGQGGVYFGTRPAIGNLPAAHMVWSELVSDRLPYGFYGTRVPGADSAYDGQANTAALINAATEKDNSPAAAWARDYTRVEADVTHKDFHLPSQLDLMLAHAHAQAAGVKFSDDVLWSSTQCSASTAFVQDFENGSSNWDFKGDKFRVRALRLIQL